MATSRQPRLRVGIIGLGRLWETRHKPALARRSDRFQVKAVYDQVARRAELEAAQLGCVACNGIAELLERPDVDAIWILTPQWFGLHALERAVGLGKPIYCALPLATEPALIERLDASLGRPDVRFMPELARRFYPATLRLKELLATTLGPPRLILGQARLSNFDRYGQPGPTTQITPAPLAIDPGGYLIDWCRFIFGSDPLTLQGFGTRVLPSGSADDDFEGFQARFAGGTLAQIAVGRYHRDVWGEAAKFLPQPGFQVFAERGVAWLEMPERIQWSGSEGSGDERLPMEPSVGEQLADQFYRLARGEQSLAPGWKDALTVARLVVGLRRSRSEDRTISLKAE